jgi:glycosyltransferase involved in cell wall biosynthesis
VVTTPTPLAAALVEGNDCGIVVDFRDPRAAAEAVMRLRSDPGLRRAQGLRGRAAAAAALNWPDHAEVFAGHLEGWAKARTLQVDAAVSSH